MAGYKNHHYAKLNDRQVFCEHCGDIKTAPAAYGYWQWHPQPWIVQPQWWYTGTNGTYTVFNHNTTNTMDTAQLDWGASLTNTFESVAKDATPQTPKSPTEKKIKGTADPEVKK